MVVTSVTNVTASGTPSSSFPVSLSGTMGGSTIKYPSNYKIFDASCVKLNRSDVFGIFDGISVYRANLSEFGMKLMNNILHPTDKKKYPGTMGSSTGVPFADPSINDSSLLMMSIASRVLIAEIGPLPSSTNLSNAGNVLSSTWYDTLLLMTEITMTAKHRNPRSLLGVYGAYEYTVPGTNQRYLHVIMETADGTIDRLAYPIDKIIGNSGHGSTMNESNPSTPNATGTTVSSSDVISGGTENSTIIPKPDTTGYTPGSNSLPVTLINSLNLPQRLTCLKDITEALCYLHFSIRRNPATSGNGSTHKGKTKDNHHNSSISTVGNTRRGSLDSNSLLHLTSNDTSVRSVPLAQRRASVDTVVSLKKLSTTNTNTFHGGSSSSPLSPTSSFIDSTYHHPDARYPGDHVPIVHGHLTPHYIFFDMLSIGKYRYKLAFYLMHMLRDQLLWVPPSTKGTNSNSSVTTVSSSLTVPCSPLTVQGYRRNESIDERNYFRWIEPPSNDKSVHTVSKSSKSLCYAEAVYAAPSVIHGIIPTAESDIYSVGMIGWSILQSVPAGKHNLPELGNRVPDYVRNIIKAAIHPDEDMRLMATELSTELSSALEALASASFRSRFAMNNPTLPTVTTNSTYGKGLSRHSYNDDNGSVRGNEENSHPVGSSNLVRSNSSFPRAPSLPVANSLSTRSLTEESSYLPNNSISTILSDGDTSMMTNGTKSVFHRASKDILGGPPCGSLIHNRNGKVSFHPSLLPSLTHLPIPIPSFANNNITTSNNSSSSSSRLQRSFDTPEADIVFLADSTGNMKKWIYALREAARELLRSPIRGHQIRIGFIGYTDVDYPIHNRTGCDELTVDFTTDFNALRNKLDAIPCTGGQDCAEDVSSGLELVLTRLNWRSRIRMVVHLAGAPPHGSKYSSVLSSIHAVGADDYPNGDPYGKDPERVIATFATEGIDYLVCKVSGGSPIESQGQMFSSPLYYPEVTHHQSHPGNGSLTSDSKGNGGGITKASLLGCAHVPLPGPPPSARSMSSPSPMALSNTKYEHSRFTPDGPSVTNDALSSKSILVQNSIDTILGPMIASFSLTYELYRTLSKTSHSSFSSISVPYTATANDFADMIVQYVRSTVMNQATSIDK